MSRNLAPIVKVSALNSFTANQRVCAQDVEAHPVQHYTGKITSVWSDGTAFVNWDFQLNFEAERHLVRNGRVELHLLTRIPS
jgi:hypothetical protein